MNVRALVSEDGGKTFLQYGANKHSDNHSCKKDIPITFSLELMEVSMNRLTILKLGSLSIISFDPVL